MLIQLETFRANVVQILHQSIRGVMIRMADYTVPGLKLSQDFYAGTAKASQQSRAVNTQWSNQKQNRDILYDCRISPKVYEWKVLYLYIILLGVPKNWPLYPYRSKTCFWTGCTGMNIIKANMLCSRWQLWLYTVVCDSTWDTDISWEKWTKHNSAHKYPL